MLIWEPLKPLIYNKYLTDGWVFSQNKGLYSKIFKITSLAYWVTKYLDGAQFGQNKVNVVFSIGFRDIKC